MFKLYIKKTDKKLKVSAVLMVMFLSGCAAKINTLAEQDRINDFVTEAHIGSELIGKDETNWWHGLESKQLNQLVAEALANNHNLHTSQLKLESALSRLGEQKFQYLPQGGVEIGAQRQSLDHSISRQSGANLSLNWQLDLFGRITALVDAANASAMSQAEQLRLLQIEVVSSVVKGFVSYQGQVEKQHIIAMQIEALKQSIEVLQAQVDDGVANEFDLNRTMAQLRQQQALMPEVEYAQFRDLSTLAVLTGRLAQNLILENEQKVLTNRFKVMLKTPKYAIALRPDISRALFEFSQASSLSVAASCPGPYWVVGGVVD